MYKWVIITLPLFCWSCSGRSPARKERPGSATVKEMRSQSPCPYPTIVHTIVRVDTMDDYKSAEERVIRWYDDKKRVIEVLKTNVYESDRKKVHADITIYDTAGRVIYENYMLGLEVLYCNSYRFDAQGKLVSKDGYQADDPAKKVPKKLAASGK
jgi:hypothetical protein